MIVPASSCWADVSLGGWGSTIVKRFFFLGVNQRTGVTGTRQWMACSFIPVVFGEMGQYFLVDLTWAEDGIRCKSIDAYGIYSFGSTVG